MRSLDGTPWLAGCARALSRHHTAVVADTVRSKLQHSIPEAELGRYDPVSSAPPSRVLCREDREFPMSHVNRIDAAGKPGDPEIRKAFDEELARAGRVTNMKATLLHSLPAFRVFSGWLTVKDEVRKAIGERALSLYSYAISATAGCLLCTTYFRRLLINEGIEPERFAPTADEALLIELGYAIGNPSQPAAPELMRRLRQRYDEPTMVNLVAYGSTMLATNTFNTTLGIELDDYLESFRTEATGKAEQPESLAG
jgi:hypothetical protein